MSFYDLEKLLPGGNGLLVLIPFTSLLSFLFIVHQYFRCRPRHRQVNSKESRLPLPPEPEVLGSWWWRICPIFTHIRALGDSPHRSLVEFDRRLGSVGALSLQLASKRAVFITGSSAVRSAANRRHFDHHGRRVVSPFDDRPDFTAYRYYAGGRSLSFARDGPAMRAHRHVAVAAIGRLVSDAGTAERIIRREADKLTAEWLDGVDMTTHSEHADVLDPAKDIQRAVGAALYSMCYGIDERLEDNEEYHDLLLGDNPGTELFAIGRQPDLFPFWARHFIMDDQKQQAHFRRMSNHVRLNDEKIRQSTRHLAAVNGVKCDGDVIVSGQCCVMDYAVAEWRRAADKLRTVGLTRDHLTALPVEFLSAGSETSSATLLWLLQLMALHTDIQKRVHEELDLYLLPGHVITFSDRHRLPLTEAVILEVFRMVPVVPLGLPHYSRHEYQLDLNPSVVQTDDTTSRQFTIPADTLVFTNLWSTGHDPDIWTDPDQFNPDRFLTYFGQSPLDVARNSEYPIKGSLSQDRNSSDDLADITRREEHTIDGGVRDQSSTSSTSRVHQPIDTVANITARIHPKKKQSNYVILNRKLANCCCPFGAGRRRCVGEPLGRLQVFLFFATLMKSCRIEMVSPPGEQKQNLAMFETFGDVVRPKPFDIRVFRRQV